MNTNFAELLLKGCQEKWTSQHVFAFVDQLLYHSFGNYVLQKMIAVVEDLDLQKTILERIKSVASQLMHCKHGPRVINKLSKTYPHIFTGNFQQQLQNNQSSSMQTTAQPFYASNRASMKKDAAPYYPTGKPALPLSKGSQQQPRGAAQPAPESYKTTGYTPSYMQQRKAPDMVA